MLDVQGLIIKANANQNLAVDCLCTLVLHAMQMLHILIVGSEKRP